jgi:hypothetical protein
MAETARSMMLATIADCWRSDARRGEARPWEMPRMSMRMGTAESMTRVSAHERVKARTRQVTQVVRYRRTDQGRTRDSCFSILHCLGHQLRDPIARE